jgi:small subunit ribosomal protein S1
LNNYLPEGMQRLAGRRVCTADDLRRAMRGDEIVSAAALLCDEAHNLHVSVGGVSGLIPRGEAAMGIAEGTARDIAILSRVGKTVCCKVTDVPAEGDVLLSRAAAQREALGYFLSALRPGDVLPAVVTNPAPFGAFCDVGCGVIALLGVENISVARISRSADRFREGQRIFAAVRTVDRAAKRISLTHRELLGTWEENAALFRAGQTVPGIVRGVKEYGVFVELTPNLSGLADPAPDLRPGDAVTVYIKSILPERAKIKLAVIGRPDPAALPPRELRYFRTSGHLDVWRYSRAENCPVTVF